MSSIDKNNQDFREWFAREYPGISLDDLFNNDLQEAQHKWEVFEKSKEEESPEPKETAPKEETRFMNVFEGEPLPKQMANSETSWIEKKSAAWKEWCAEEKRNYIYERDEKLTESLKFDVYKTPEDKAAGKKDATFHYTSETDVVISTPDNKAPAYEYFDKMAKDALANGIGGITFAGKMSADFKAKLAAAAIANGMKTEGFDGVIDMSQLMSKAPHAP